MQILEFVRSLGNPSSDLKLHRALIEGFPLNYVEDACELTGISQKELARHLGLTPAALSEMRRSGRLSPYDSEKVFNLVAAFSKAALLFDNNKNATLAWLNQPAPELNNARSLDMLTTYAGFRAVMSRIDDLDPESR